MLQNYYLRRCRVISKPICLIRWLCQRKLFFYRPRAHQSSSHISNNKNNSTSIRKYSTSVVVLSKKGTGIEGHTDDEEGLTYKDSSVDIDASEELVRRIAKRAPGIGGFSGLVPLGDLYLVTGMDGVGTKLKLAFESGMHETFGIDLVAMSVNDIVTSGAKPLCFLDYYATSRLDVDLAEKVIIGIKNGCQQCGCELLGGETAEMPDFYAQGEYDLSGCAIGTVKKDSLIDGKNIKVGDVLIGLPSSGLHSNGFSLVRRVLERSGCSLKDNLPGTDITLSESLLTPTIIYVKQAGRIEYVEMRRTFNMGIGMVLVVSKESASKILAEANGQNVAYRIGEVVSGHGVIYQ
ncbi:Phosphoribosylformylglycinamidine cyclo-ligase, chloroplastic [Orobanche minor]